MGATPDSRVLRVLDSGGGCDVDRVVLVHEDESEVQLEILRDDHGVEGSVCPAVAWARTVQVELQQPLGQRRVIDAATAQTVRTTANYRGPT